MTTKITKRDIDEAFAVCDHQGDILLFFYRCMFPNWNDIEKLDGWPKCNDWTWKYISRKFMDFDHKHHPDVMRGGAWMNSGFSGADAEHLANFEFEDCGYVTLAIETCAAA